MSNNNLYKVLKKISSRSSHKKQKGEYFEKLMFEFFKQDPEYKNKFINVWMWTDSPVCKNRKFKADIGVDVVAQTQDKKYVAIQCKFHESSKRLTKANVDSFLNELGKTDFQSGIIVSTHSELSSQLKESINSRKTHCQYIGLEKLEKRRINFYDLYRGTHKPKIYKNKLKPHQQKALQDVVAGFQQHSRGQLIMPCGTGKTFTALKIAEAQVPKKGVCLVLMPSLSLVSQIYNEFNRHSHRKLAAPVVCSDNKAGSDNTNEEMSLQELTCSISEPPSTNPNELVEYLSKHSKKTDLTVIFSTYHSIEVVAKAQKIANFKLDLIICDEAHRTTGVENPNSNKKSHWNRVHNNKFIKASKRLYMTATPRIYTERTKAKASQIQVDVFSMDDVNKYGPEFHELRFSQAISKGLLSDYKVVVLGLDPSYISASMQNHFAQNNELKSDDAAKIVGCYQALSKNFLNSKVASMTGQGYKDIKNKKPMQRAVAFSSTIKESKQLQKYFQQVVDKVLIKSDQGQSSNTQPVKTQDENLRCFVEHVDGHMDSQQRGRHLRWIKAENQEPIKSNECRILSNARCLSEGVDVPALDAVMFLKACKSEIEIIQAVGRVMRKPRNKKKEFGYIILPVIMPTGVDPNEALKNNECYSVIWKVVKALRSHDDRLGTQIDRLRAKYSTQDPDNIITSFIGSEDDKGEAQRQSDELANQVEQATKIDWQKAIVAKIVEKCGDRVYPETLSKNIKGAYEQAYSHLKKRIQASANGAGARKYTKAIEKFVCDLQRTLNPSIDKERAIEMLAIHSVMRPLFEALFGGEGNFNKHNPVSQAMNKVLRLFNNQIQAETQELKKNYESIKRSVQGIDTSTGRQKLISDLYGNVFKQALPKLQVKNGIVYTPIEVVDFMLHSVNYILRHEFNKSLQDEGVKILDPFSGTGTFLTRLIENPELISDQHLKSKYQNEMWACEIMLLAYYISTVNIEHAYLNRLKLARSKTQQAKTKAESRASASTGANANASQSVHHQNKLDKLSSAPDVVSSHAPEYNNFSRLRSKSVEASLDLSDCLFRGAIFADTFQSTEAAANGQSFHDQHKNMGTNIGSKTKTGAESQLNNIFNNAGGSGGSPKYGRQEVANFKPLQSNNNLKSRSTDASSDDSQLPDNVFDINNHRKQKMTHDDIRVIIGNPPYSAGQKNENDNNKNLKYKNLDARIAQTYAEDSKATSKRSVYDSYVRALRWATDKLNASTSSTPSAHQYKGASDIQTPQSLTTVNTSNRSGIVAFITNASFIDNQSLDGLRHHLARDFTSLYILNLRGGIRGRKGDDAKKEGANIFGQNSRCQIAISFLVKHPQQALSAKTKKTNHIVKSPLMDGRSHQGHLDVQNHATNQKQSDNQTGQIYYCDIGDYLSCNDKLNKLNALKSIEGILSPTTQQLNNSTVPHTAASCQASTQRVMPESHQLQWRILTPDSNNDWLNQCNLHYQDFSSMSSFYNGKPAIFNTFSRGAITCRDEWAYNFNPNRLLENMQNMVDVYNDDLKRYQKTIASEIEASRPDINAFVCADSTKISWSRLLKRNLKNNRPIYIKKQKIRSSLYRPFCKKHCYYTNNKTLTEEVYQTPKSYPTTQVRNLSILTSGKGAKLFSTFITDITPNLDTLDKSQHFPRYIFKAKVAADIKKPSSSLQSKHKSLDDVALSLGRMSSVKNLHAVDGSDPKKLINSRSSNESDQQNLSHLHGIGGGEQQNPVNPKKSTLNIKHKVLDNKKISMLQDGAGDQNNTTSVVPKTNHKSNSYTINRPEIDGYNTIDNISSEVVEQFQQHYDDPSIDGDALFYYIYGLLHSRHFVDKYKNDLLKQLPRIPMVGLEKTEFHTFARAGKQLADLHLNYDKPKVDFYKDLKINGESAEQFMAEATKKHGPTGAKFKNIFRVTKKMKPGKKNGSKDHSTIVYNEHITISDIPEKACTYKVNGYSPMQWVMDRYYCKTHTKSQILDDPNRPDEPEYIVNLLRRVVNVAVQSAKIIKALPDIKTLHQGQGQDHDSSNRPTTNKNLTRHKAAGRKRARQAGKSKKVA